MMKRSNAIHWFICGVLGMSTGVLLQLAISQSSIGYGTLSVIAAVACILNLLITQSIITSETLYYLWIVE